MHIRRLSSPESPPRPDASAGRVGRSRGTRRLARGDKAGRGRAERPQRPVSRFFGVFHPRVLIFLLILLIFNWLLIFFGVFRTAAVNFSALNSRGARRPAASPLCPPLCPSAAATTSAAATLAVAWDRARLGLVKGEASGAQARPALAQPAVRAGFSRGAAAGRPGWVPMRAGSAGSAHPDSADPSQRLARCRLSESGLSESGLSESKRRPKWVSAPGQVVVAYSLCTYHATICLRSAPLYAERST